MNTTPRWCGGAAQKDLWVGGGVGVESCDWASEELAEIGDSTGDGATHIVGIELFELPRGRDVFRQDDVFEAWRESFDLVFDGIGHVSVELMRNVTIGVSSMLPQRGTGVIELALLAQDQEGML